MAKPVYGGGGLPSGKVFDQSEEEKKQAASIRKAAAANLATQTSPLDVIGDIAPYAGAIIGGVASGGNPQAIQAGYKAGSAIGGVVGGDRKKAEATYQEASEEEMALDNPEAAAKMRQARLKQEQEAKQKPETDAFTQALSLYGKYKETNKGK